MGNPSDSGSRGWLGRAVAAAVVAAAAALRLWNLGGLPEGLHGDEAWTGLDARRILAEGWIGPYVPSALGQPSGPLYVVAGLLHFLPDDIATVRLGMALFGILGVAFTLLAVREYEGPVVACFAALLLAASLWHLHASRIGMMFVSLPTLLMAGFWVQAVARRRDSHLLYALAGFVAGLGIYTYNAYPVAAPLFAVPFLYTLGAARDRAERRRRLAQAACFAAAALLAAAPMIHYVVRDPVEYFRHHKLVAMAGSPEWKENDWSVRGLVLLERADKWLRGLVWEGQFDGGDAFGVGGIPVLDPVASCLVVVGIALALWRWRRCLSGLALVALPLIGLAAILTSGAGMYRRTIALAPFIAILAALPLGLLWGAGTAPRSPRWRAAGMVLAVALAAASVWSSVRTYFGPFAHDPKLRWVFARELRAVGEFAAGVPAGTKLYLFSERWGCGYETMRYLAPKLVCVDRSRRFGKLSRRSGMLDFAVAAEQPAMFMFVGDHLERRRYVMERYPQAQQFNGEIDGAPAFAAVHLPAGAGGKMARAAAPPPDRPGHTPLSVLALEPFDVLYEFEPPRENLTWNGHPLRLGGRTFARGLGMHAPTEMMYAVPPRAVELRATVGLSEAVKDCTRASVVFEVRDQKGRVIATSKVMRAGDSPRLLRADLRDVREFALIANDANDGRDCDHANWGNPAILRRPADASPAASEVLHTEAEERPVSAAPETLSP